VAYRTLPGDAYHAVIIPTENLPDSYHDALIQLVESSSAQDSYEFADVLSRSNFPDGSTMLAALHTQGKLTKVPTSQVEMLPNFNVKINLAELNVLIAQQNNVAVDDLAIKSSSAKVQVKEVGSVSNMPAETNDLGKTTSASVNETYVEPTKFDSAEAEAKHYRSQADKLAKQAADMRRKAEELVPTKKK
jgi:hypothetical protein